MNERPITSRDPRAIRELCLAIYTGLGETMSLASYSLGLSEDVFQRLLMSQEPITDDIAERIERALLASRLIAANLGNDCVEDFRRHCAAAVRISRECQMPS